MAEKDILEKALENYDDVFSDIVNGLLFQGKQRISEQALVSVAPTSEYKIENGIHEQERDVAKIWIEQDKKIHVRIALLGLENQTIYDPDMPLRVIGYDGAAYRGELGQKQRYPIVTLVLNFDKKRWGKSRSLYDRIRIPEGLEPFVSNYHINVFDICFLTEEEINYFHSDFRIVADYFVHSRTNPDYRPSDPEKFRHTDALLKLLSALKNDQRFAMTLNDKKGGKPQNMCEVLDRVEARGKAEGITEGEKKLADLIQKLLETGRNEDIARVTSDPLYRKRLYEEFQIT